MRLLRLIIAFAMLCGPCSPNSHAGPLKRWKAARAARHTPASATPYCGPNGCDPATLSIPPGFQALTPLASQQVAQVAVSAPGVNVQVPVAQAVAAPAPPAPTPQPPTPEPPAPSAGPYQVTVEPVMESRLRSIEQSQESTAAILAAMAKELGVEMPQDVDPGAMIDRIPDVVVEVQYHDHTERARFDLSQTVRNGLRVPSDPQPVPLPE